MKLREVLRSSLKVMTIGVIAGLAASKSLANKNSKTFFMDKWLQTQEEGKLCGFEKLCLNKKIFDKS